MILVEARIRVEKLGLWTFRILSRAREFLRGTFTSVRNREISSALPTNIKFLPLCDFIDLVNSDCRFSNDGIGRKETVF